MKTFLYIMANDTKWVRCEHDLPFAPYPGMDIEGLAGEQPLRISGMAYDVGKQTVKVRLAWLSQDPLRSADLVALNVGWELV